jgi:hypothetical protein
MFKKILLLIALLSLFSFVSKDEIQLDKNMHDIDNNNKIEIHKACQLHQFDDNIKNVCFEYEI